MQEAPCDGCWPRPAIMGATDFEKTNTEESTDARELLALVRSARDSVGGSQLTLDDSGKRLAPDVVWNDFAGAGRWRASRRCSIDPS